MQISIVVILKARSILVDLWQAILRIKFLLLTLPTSIKIRSLSLGGHANSMSSMRHKPICGRMITYPVIPVRNIVLAKLEPDLHFWRRCSDFIEKADDVVGFNLWDADDFGDEAGVEEEGFPACDGVDSDEGVFCYDGVAAYWSTDCS